MKVGFALPHQGPVATRDNMRLVATEAELMGYDSLWTNERLLVPVNAKTPYPGNAEGVLDEEYKAHLDHLTCMTYVSAITERVRLGVSVINIPWYNPVLLAKRLAAMDVLSNGRITVGVGLAWSEDECDAANIPYRERGRIGEEAIECLLAVWGPDPVEYHGKYFNLEPAYIGPKPVQKPHPPIIVGAFAPKALDRAGRLADGFTGCCAPVDALISMMRQVKEAAAERGRDPDQLISVMRCLVNRTDERLDDATRAVTHGTWDQIADDARKMADAGVDEIFFDVAFQKDAQSRDGLLRYMERFREMVGAGAAV
ncbi:MAG TPA: TIGR03619 family F420-dependent LLM class oxidoreductase [Candidatus Dormibacteraeota bacterium]|nr:TIGR03619 family F420-dependent LLM class oxidoreductase [Candidatus Dormibacteraeota bacterium]